MPATNTTTRRLHAEPAYENAHLVALDLLDRIRELLYSLPAHGGDHPPIRWEQVAGLVEVNSYLAAAMTHWNSRWSSPAETYPEQRVRRGGVVLAA